MITHVLTAIAIYMGYVETHALSISVPIVKPKTRSPPNPTSPESTNVAPPVDSKYDDYLDALLQSTGLKRPNPEFLSNYYSRIYGDQKMEVNVNRTTFNPNPLSDPPPQPFPNPVRLPSNVFTRPPTRFFPFSRPQPIPVPNPNPIEPPSSLCPCAGCLINGECIGCLNRAYCKRVEGVYCEHED